MSRLRPDGWAVAVHEGGWNPTVGGDSYRDATFTEVMAGLARAAARPAGGGLLVTSRYPLPGRGSVLATIAVPPLSPAELRRLFLRLPALRDLDAADRRLLTRTVGGHPRLIEFTDALLRGGRANLSHVRDKLQACATTAGLSEPEPGLGCGYRSASAGMTRTCSAWT